MNKRIWLAVTFLVLLIAGGYFLVGYWFINPILGSVFAQLRPTPTYQLILTDYKLTGLKSSLNSPWAIFPFEIEKNFSDSNMGYGTGLVNLETNEVTVLAARNWIPLHTSLFSPDGQKVLYTIANQENVFKNENGTWREIKSVDIHYRDLKTSQTKKVASNVSVPWFDPLFGWIDDQNIYYVCPNGVDMYCVVDINILKIQQKTSLGQVYKDEVPDSSKINNGGKSLDNSLTLYRKCILPGFDGCAYSIVRLSNNENDVFLGNRQDLDGEFVWTYGNRLYVLPTIWGGIQTKSGIVQIR